eukprot:RCo030946
MSAVDERALGAAEGRSTGKAVGGRIRVGQLLTNPGQPQQASIPSKFETIFHPGQREKEGFNRRTPRFTPSETDIPGPGSYAKVPTMVRDPTAEYTSKHGTAAFASTAKIRNDLPRPSFLTPGPGTYSGASTSPNWTQRTSLKGTAAFIERSSKPLLPPGSTLASTQGTPGPGQYETPLSTLRGVPGSSSSSASIPPPVSAIFKSTTGRSSHLATASKLRLGPGEYADAVLQHRSVAAMAAAMQSRPEVIPNPFDPAHPKPAPPVTDSVFRSTTNRFEKGKPLNAVERLDPKNLPPVPGVPASSAGPPAVMAAATAKPFRA